MDSQGGLYTLLSPTMDECCLPPAAAAYSGLVLGTLFYGVYAVLFVLYILVGPSRRRAPTNKVFSGHLMTICNITLFAAITMQWIIGLCQYSNYFDARGRDTPVPSADGLGIMYLMLYFAATTVANFGMIYRLRLVSSLKLVVLPIFTCLFGLATGATSASYLEMAPNYLESPGMAWMTSALAMTACTAVYCSALLSYRIWVTRRAVQHAQSDTSDCESAASTARIIGAIGLESTWLFTACTIVVIIVHLTRRNATFACMSIVSPLIGSAFCIMRLAGSKARRALSSEQVGADAIALRLSPVRFAAKPRVARSNETLSLDFCAIDDADSGMRTPVHSTVSSPKQMYHIQGS